MLFWQAHSLVFTAKGTQAGMTSALVCKRDEIYKIKLHKTFLSTNPTPTATSDLGGQCQPDLTGMKSSKTEFLQA